MLKITLLNATIQTTILRYYLLLTVVTLGGLTGNWVLTPILALVILLTAILGVKFTLVRKPKTKKAETMEIHGNTRGRKQVLQRA